MKESGERSRLAEDGRLACGSTWLHSASVAMAHPTMPPSASSRRMTVCVLPRPVRRREVCDGHAEPPPYHREQIQLPNESPSGCLFSIFRLLGIGQAGATTETEKVPLPYRRKDFLLSRAEASFYGALNNAVAGQYLIFAKVRLADLLYIPRGTESRQSAFNRIQSKHIDFVLCFVDGVKPCLAIELDDASHDEEDRRARDGFVEAALATAGLPFLRVRAAASYNIEQLRQGVAALVRPTA